MPTPRSEQSSTYRQFYEAIKAIRKGSLSDALTLSSEVDTVPIDLLPDLLEAFLSHVESHKFPLNYRQRVPVEKRYILGLYAFKGLGTMVNLDNFPQNPHLATRIFQQWKDIFHCTQVFHNRAVEKNATELLPFLKAGFVLIFNKISLVVLEEMLPVFEDVEFQAYVSRLWLEVPDDSDNTYFEISKLIWSCLKYPTCMDSLLKIAEGPEPARTVAKSTIDRLDILVNRIPFKDRDCGLVAMECAIFQALMTHPNHKISLALVNNGGFKLVMKSLRYSAKLMNNGGCDDERQPFLCAGSCLTFLSVAFEVKPKMIRKAIRGGYIHSLFAVSPWLEKLESIRPKTVLATKYALKIIIPRELVFPKNIELMAEAIKNASPEARKNIRDSDISQEWIEVEKLVMERLALLKIGDMSRHIVTCCSCNRKDYKHSFRKCGRCSKALYCSKVCQAVDWKSGHKELCCVDQDEHPSTPSSMTSISSLMSGLIMQYDRDARMRRDMLLRDISRYSEDNIQQNVGIKLLKADIDPYVHAVKITHLMELSFEILEITRLFKDDIFNDRAAGPDVVDYWVSQLLKADKKGALCLMIVGSGQEMIAQLQIVPLCMTNLWRPPSITHPKELTRPMSSNSTVYTKKTKESANVTSHFDAVAHLLFYTGLTLDDFWRTNFDEVVRTWLRTCGFQYSLTAKMELPDMEPEDWDELFCPPQTFKSTWAHYPPEKTLASSVAELLKLF